MNHSELQSILYRALAEPIGLLVRSSDRARLRQQLYSIRGKIGDPRLAMLQIRFSPFQDGEQDLVLVKGEAGGQARVQKAESSVEERIPAGGDLSELL